MNPDSFLRIPVVVLAIVLVRGPVPAQNAPPGLVSAEPREGRFVQTAHGYMVPWEMTIPGTEVTFQMLPVPAGVLRRPDPEVAGGVLEIPVQPFWIGRCEVTWAEYDHYQQLRDAFRLFQENRIRRLTAQNGIDAVTAPSSLYISAYPELASESEQKRHPAVSMTQFAARQYTKWLSLISGQVFRLPTEAEWEYACQAGSDSPWPDAADGENLSGHAWFAGNSAEETHPVGQLLPNRWGICDLHGNAAEWVLDAHDPGRSRLRKLLQNGKQPVVWPAQQYARLVCGGSWAASAEQCRSDSRMISAASWKEIDPNLPQSPHWLASETARQIGFRIVCPLEPPTQDERSRYWDADVPEVEEAIRQTTHIQRGPVDPELPADFNRLRKP